jgi:hypothetical protein
MRSWFAIMLLVNTNSPVEMYYTHPSSVLGGEMSGNSLHDTEVTKLWILVKINNFCMIHFGTWTDFIREDYVRVLNKKSPAEGAAGALVYHS